MLSTTTPLETTETVHDRVSSTDGVILHRWIVRPMAPPKARLLVVHGYGDHAGRFRHVLEWMASHGVWSTAFDFRGHGVSTGRRGFVWRFEDQLDDLRAVLTTPELADPHRATDPLFILGHSNGGLVCAAAGARGLIDCAGVILSSPYLRAAHEVPILKRALGVVTNLLYPWLRVPSGIGGEPMTADEAMIQDTKNDPLVLRCATPRWYAETTRVQAGILNEAPKFALPLLCFMGDKDTIASAEVGEEFARRASSTQKQFQVLPGQFHEPLRDVGREALMETILAWMTT